MENNKAILFIKNAGKTLLKNGAEFASKSDHSNSVYYNIGGVKIRVSDHFPSSNYGKCINIVCTSNNDSAIVCVQNRPIVYKNTRELNSFIHMFCDYARCESKGLLNSIDESILERTESLNKIRNEISGKQETYQKLCSLVSKQQKILDTIGGTFPEELDFQNLNDKQKKNIVSMMRSYAKQNEKNLKASKK